MEVGDITIALLFSTLSAYVMLKLSGPASSNVMRLYGLAETENALIVLTIHCIARQPRLCCRLNQNQ